ncbi:DUF397 domain-containing protein [Embleya sp. MST-111070]|uniref:DUF397 domain-containing protein n=1 Tax=Embleya sp. MST-111070 TaxID=3398231 RepID=UPI003F7400D8
MVFSSKVVAGEWRKSSYSGATNECVEAAGLDKGGAAVRDSKDPSVGQLAVSASSWAALTAALRA